MRPKKKTLGDTCNMPESLDAKDKEGSRRKAQIAVAHKISGIRRIRPATRKHVRDFVHGCLLRELCVLFPVYGINSFCGGMTFRFQPVGDGTQRIFAPSRKRD